MMALLILKSKIKNFYEKHYRLVRGILKVCVVFAVLLIVTTQLNYQTTLGQYWLLIGIALLCGVTPDLVSVLCILAVVEAEIYQVSQILAVSLILVILIYYLLFGRLTQKQSIVLMSVPVLSVIHLSYVVPIVAGLFFSPIMLPALIVSVFLHFVMTGIQEYALAVSRVTEESTPIAALQYLVEYLKGNRLFLILLTAFVLTFICTYLIRRTKIQYASQVAILVGAILILSILLLSNIALDLDVDLLRVVISILCSVAIAYIVQFFRMTLDYQGTRKLQFEDDEYYYYVTAVPKFKVAVVDKTLTRIVPDEEDENLDLKTELEKELEEDFGDSSMNQ